MKEKGEDMENWRLLLGLLLWLQFSWKMSVSFYNHMLLDDFYSLIYLEDHLGLKDSFSDQAKFGVVSDIFVFQ